MTHFNGLANDVWPLPPRGISVSRTNQRGGVLIQYTYLCENEGCMAIAFSQDSELHARQQVAGHECPQRDGSRGLIPTGKTLVQNMWDEADSALDAFKAGKKFKGIDPSALPSYVRGIAECLTFCTVPCYKVTDDVLRELNRRWKMRQGEIPFAPTPSYNYNPHLDAARAKSMSEETKAAKIKAPAKKTVQPKATKPEPEKQLSSAERDVIRASFHQGLFTTDDIAKLYGITPERVLAIAGPKPTGQSQSAPIIHIF